MGEQKNVDIESVEFKEELKKTIKFTDKILKQFNFVYNKNDEIVESIQFGLTRNKLIYNKRYCPCFFVTQTKEDRICPCKPALKEEIPKQGYCHCGIFCTEEYASTQKEEEKVEEIVHQHSRGLTVEECELLLKKEALDSDELESLMEAKKLKMIKFNLVDTREPYENKQLRITDTDYLIPTTSFYEKLKDIEDKKDIPVVVYCHTGSRSAYCQRIMGDLGFKQVGNLTYGIISYRGQTERG